MGNRRPGGKVDPVIVGERSWTVNSPFGRGVKTSSSRLTSVNCVDGHDAKIGLAETLRTL